MTTIAEDIDFALNSGEFSTTAPALRYVASLHPEATRAEFVAACVSCGYRDNTATNRFYESRKFDCESYGYTLLPDGRMEI